MKKYNKKNRAKQIVKAEFTAGTLTNFSGLNVIHNFVEKIDVRKLLNNISIDTHHNIKYETGDILSILVEGVSCGMNRLSKIENFTLDPLVQKLYGLSDKLSDATISDRLKRCTMKQTSEYMDVIGKLSGKVHNKLQTKSDILDLDSSVSIVYGSHEEPATFRAWFVQLAGKVAKTGRQTLLKMYKAYYYIITKWQFSQIKQIPFLVSRW